MDLGILGQLVDNWHAAAKAIPGYRDTTPDGDGVQLLLLAHRSKEGDLVLTAMAVTDRISAISLGQLLRPDDIASATDPTIPISSVTIADPDIT